MSSSPGTRIVPKTFRIRNPMDSPLKVWIEPWADQHELARGESLDVSFVGPEEGIPVFLPAERSLAIYGWQDCDFIVFQNGRVAGKQPTVREIVEQELEIAADLVHLKKDVPLPLAEIEATQRSLDDLYEVNVEGQRDACTCVGYLVMELVDNYLVESAAATTVVWNIASRVVRTKGLILTELRTRDKSTLWSGGSIADLILARSISTLSGGPNASGIEVDSLPTKLRHDDSQSGPVRK